tara:strand:+ start:644 stop:1627 length:984 start_codon:yes stop_codon:yes gene_type:complete
MWGRSWDPATLLLLLGICNFFEASRNFGLYLDVSNTTPIPHRTVARLYRNGAVKGDQEVREEQAARCHQSAENVAKIKQKKQMDVKKKERKARDNAKAEDLGGDSSKKSGSRPVKDDGFGEMSMDQFFEGGFQVPEMSKKSATKPKTGKRKRTPIENGDAADSDAEMGEAGASAEESATDSDSGDDADAHKEQLAELQKKDPEFYKYLKDNDAELLDFAEDADLAEIDALSASEDETTPRKKKKKAAAVESDEDDEEEATTGNEVTTKLTKKWKSSMEANSSLRAMREVVLAFRTAAHLNDDEGKNYKYTISDPEGTIYSPVCLHPY